MNKKKKWEWQVALAILVGGILIGGILVFVVIRCLDMQARIAYLEGRGDQEVILASPITPVDPTPPIPLPVVTMLSSLREETIGGGRWLLVEVSFFGETHEASDWTLSINGEVQTWGSFLGGKEPTEETRLEYPPGGTEIIPLVRMKDGRVLEGLVIVVP